MLLDAYLKHMTTVQDADLLRTSKKSSTFYTEPLLGFI